ncbi:TPA: restriction endonuclease subunit S [Escherichia coli]|uniref:Restriction-modification system protein HsdS n=4 Tax=Escherichia coli TaxID=562 RepID=A0A400L2G1_ECOLX|nr:restriction endonuclease subunit S [Escherichia coli]EAC1957168.1 restriction endonuclease subunit S [Escherichia coli]EEQ1625353.1 restriction endonuclease subunit S [Escherichia coli]EEQ2701722.1 restriction endonuclease subunit S [Escherichia coli]EEQ3671426.1 restriction endonuclease subunit S [Escherichia coli]EEQ7740609.1 restriction endonuclease subunit S [Escherichia coli]
MVPKGWMLKQLSDIVKEKISYGIVQAGPHIPNGIPYIKSSDIRGAIDPASLQRTAPEIHYKYRRSAVHPGDIIFSLRGNIGETAIVPSNLLEANLTQGTARISVSGDQCNEFYHQQFAMDKLRNYINSLSKGSTFKEISLEELRKVKVLCAPLPEQKKIAQILSTWDKAITVTEKLLVNSQQQKKALMQQLLTGKKRLLDENGVRFSTEWEFKRISEIATRVQRKNDAAEHPILTISSLSGFVRQDERYSRYMAGESVKNYILLKKGEFAYNKGNSKTYEFGCIFDLEAYEAGLVPHVYVCFRLKNGLSHRYFKYLFEADYLKPQLGALVNTGVRNNGLLNIKPTEFMQTKVPVPCFEEQESIADMLYNSSRTIRVLQDKLACLKDEKKALMQQLLTGKRRVKVDEAVAV